MKLAEAYFMLAVALLVAGYVMGRTVTEKNTPKDRLAGFGLNNPNSEGEWWSKGREEAHLQDESGQVFWLRQVEQNNNIYEVWVSMGETNGITNSFHYRTKSFFGTNRNVIVNWTFESQQPTTESNYGNH